MFLFLRIKIILIFSFLIYFNQAQSQFVEHLKDSCIDSIFFSNVEFSVVVPVENDEVYSIKEILGVHLDTLIIARSTSLIKSLSMFQICIINDSSYRVREYFPSGQLKAIGICLLIKEDDKKKLIRMGKWRIRYSLKDSFEKQEFN